MSMMVALGAIMLFSDYEPFGRREKSGLYFSRYSFVGCRFKIGRSCNHCRRRVSFYDTLYSRTAQGERFSMLKELEHDLHYWVAFLILPLFAFVNAGVDLKGASVQTLVSNVSLGIALGLFFGKQIGVFCFSYIAVKLK